MSVKQPINILLVDDEPANLLSLDAALGALGENLVHAGSGEEALRHALNTDFAVILLDLHLPDISGFEVAQLIRSRLQSQKTAVIFVTAWGQDDFPVEQAYALGAVDYLVKPLNPIILRAKVAVFIDLYRKTEDLARVERARMKMALGAKDDRIRLILDNARSYAFIFVDAAGVITEWEGGAASITGWDAPEAIGQTTSLIFTPEDRAAGQPEAELQAAKRTGQAQDRRWHVCRDGSRFFAEGVMVRLQDQDGTFRGCAKIFRDATAEQLIADELQAGQENLRHLAADLAQVNQRKTEFLSILAHELRNPLAPIRSGMGVLRQQIDASHALHETIGVIDRQVTHMVRLVDDLLDVARISGGKIELRRQRIDLQSVLAHAVETALPALHAAHHEFVLEVPTTPILVDVDPTRFAQVVSNLLNNAGKYTPHGGRIVLSADEALSEIVVAIQDNGVGIPEASLQDIFEIFSQVGDHLERAQGGLGIGLSLARRLVELHGGVLTAVSGGAGQGSTFAIRLPREIRAVHAPAEPAPCAAVQVKGVHPARVLIADDNVDAADMFAAYLQALGCVTEIAVDGQDALDRAATFAADIAFIDIGMPAMNGYEVAQALRQRPGSEKLVLVALTGWGADSDRERSKKAGFDHHVTKPADLDVVAKILAALHA